MLSSKIQSVLTEYCEQSTLAGVNYILERRFVASGIFDNEINGRSFNCSFHYTERVFWFVCVLATSLCAGRLMLEYLDLFQTNAVTLVVERWKPSELVKFPAVVVCENGVLAEEYPAVQRVMKGLEPKDAPYNYDVDDFILKFTFINLYNQQEFEKFCGSQCENCKRCPDKHYKEIAEQVMANCTALFEVCMWKNKPFDCCTHFKAIQTSIGKCFAMGSLHSEDHGKRELDEMFFSWRTGSEILNITINRAAVLYILNEEDIPDSIVTRTKMPIISPGIGQFINVLLNDISSDIDVRRVLPKYRKCLFPDETPKHYTYRHYSSTVCMTECLRQVQLKECNCISHNMPGNESLICSYNGYICLDNKDILFPLVHQHLAEISTECSQCLPSCNERMIHITDVYEMFELEDQNSRRFELAVLPMTAIHYRRQAVRTYLNIFVSIGGILGLFTGASVLSYVEIVYYFTWKVMEAVLNKNRKHEIKTDVTSRAAFPNLF